MVNAQKKSILVAGASGAVGRRLCRLLVADGWRVAGTTRSQDKAAALQALGVTPIVADVFDAERRTTELFRAAKRSPSWAGDPIFASMSISKRLAISRLSR